MAGRRRSLYRSDSYCRRLPPMEQTARVSEEKRDVAGVAQWEAGLATTEGSLAEYCATTRRAARSDGELLWRQHGGESKAAVATAFLTKQEQKAEEIEKLKQEMIDLKQQAQDDKKKLADYYNQKIKELEEKFQQKVREYDQIQSELKSSKAFCREKAAVEKVTEDLKESVAIPNRRHQEVVVGLERFLEEKKVLEEDTEKKQIMMPETAQCRDVLKSARV